MEITHLRYFKKTAELEHITKAAQELHVAQPSLSRTISMLEDELKVKLFNRKGKSIELNEYGIIVLNHTNRILKELEAGNVPQHRPQTQEPEDQVSLMDMDAIEIRDRLAKISVETLTPIEAMSLLYELKQKLSK